MSVNSYTCVLQVHSTHPLPLCVSRLRFTEHLTASCSLWRKKWCLTAFQKRLLYELRVWCVQIWKRTGGWPADRQLVLTWHWLTLKLFFESLREKKSIIIIQDVVIENDAYTSSAFYFWGLRAIDSQHTVEVTAIVKKWHTSKTFCSGLPGVCSAAVTLHSFNNMIWTVDGVKVHKWNRHGGRGFVGFHYHKPV